MSRDYKPRAENTKNSNTNNPFLTGMMIGFLCGVIASLALVMFIKGKDSPFAVQGVEPPSKLAEKIAEDTKNNAKSAGSGQQQQEEKARFDFYTILPGSESKVSVEEESKIVEEAPQPEVQKSYFLQVGAFQTGEEADNMKATLALQGFEAVVQTATIPEKGVWHRVRVGPLKSLDQINQTKESLLANGFKADLIKVNNEN
jgi:cell division protein FtsN